MAGPAESDLGTYFKFLLECSTTISSKIDLVEVAPDDQSQVQIQACREQVVQKTNFKHSQSPQAVLLLGKALCVGGFIERAKPKLLF